MPPTMLQCTLLRTPAFVFAIGIFADVNEGISFALILPSIYAEGVIDRLA